MIITRKPGESDQDFRARAFAAAREHHAQTLTHLSADQIAVTWVENVRSIEGLHGRRYLISEHKFEQATPMSWSDYKAARTVTELAEPPRMSRLRAIWYTCGLVAASAVIAMAVFWDGELICHG